MELQIVRPRDRGSWLALISAAAVLVLVGIASSLTNRIPDVPGGDGVRYYVPIRVFSIAVLKMGALPGWNPFAYTGYPHIADLQSGFFYLPNLLFYALLAPAVAYNVSIAFNVLLMAFFSWAFLRVVVRNRYAVWIGAATYSLSGFMANNAVTVTVADAAAWVPAAFWCTHRWLETGRWRYCFWGGVCLAMQLLAGWPQLVLLTAIYLTVYLLFWLPKHPRRARAFIGFVLIGVISAGLGMAQLLPTLEFKDQTIVDKLNFNDFVSGSVPPQLMVLMLFPFLVGAGYGQLHTLHKVAFYGPVDQQVPSYYVGILPLLLAVVALARWRQSRMVRAASVMLALACLLTWTGYMPWDRWMYRVPGMNLFHDHRINVVFIAYSVALLAACGAEALLSDTFTAARRRILAWSIPAGVLALAVVVLVKIRAILGSIPPSLNPMPQGWVQNLHQVMRFNSPDLLVSVAILVATAILFRYWMLRPSNSRLALLATVFVCADLLYCGLSPNWFTTPIAATAAEQDAMSMMRDTASGQAFRSLSLVRDPAISPNMSTMFQHADILGLGPLLPKRHSDLLTAATNATVRWPELVVNNTVLSLLNTRFIEVDDGQLATIQRMMGPFTAGESLNRGTATPNLFDGATSQAGGAPTEIRSEGSERLAIRQTTFMLDPDSSYELSFAVRFTDPHDWYGLGIGFAAEDTQYYYGINSWMLAEGPDFHNFRRLFITDKKPGKVYVKLFTMSTSPIYVKNLSLVKVGSFPLGNNPYKLAGTYGDFHVLENTRAYPRAFFVSEVKPVPDFSDARALLWQTATPFDARNVALVEAPAGELPASVGRGRVDRSDYTPNRDELDVTCDATCYLVLAALEAPGWKASVDGHRTAIYRTDTMLRGIVIGPGKHHVEFQYAPLTLSYGIAASIATFGLVLIITVASLRRDKARQKTTAEASYAPAVRS